MGYAFLLSQLGDTVSIRGHVKALYESYYVRRKGTASFIALSVLHMITSIRRSLPSWQRVEALAETEERRRIFMASDSQLSMRGVAYRRRQAIYWERYNWILSMPLNSARSTLQDGAWWYTGKRAYIENYECDHTTMSCHLHLG